MNETAKRSLLVSICGDMTVRDRRNLNRATWWLLAWAMSFAAAALLTDRGVVPAGPAAWAVAALPAVFAIAALLAYGRYLREADELQRQIQLQALALGFGAGLFAGFGYSLFERLGAPAGDITDASSVMVFFYFVGLWLGRRRYA